MPFEAHHRSKVSFEENIKHRLSLIDFEDQDLHIPHPHLPRYTYLPTDKRSEDREISDWMNSKPIIMSKAGGKKAMMPATSQPV